MSKKFSLQYVNEIVEKNNGKLLSKKYKNIKTRLNILCNVCSEKFKISLYKIKKGVWCPICRLSKPQQLLYKIFKNIYPHYIIKTNYKKFSWLRGSSGKKQELDIFIYNKDKSFTCAIEYDGEQHFMPVKFGAKSDAEALMDLQKIQKMDIIKDRKIAKHSNDIKYFIRFNYKQNITQEFVCKVLQENRIPYAI